MAPGRVVESGLDRGANCRRNGERREEGKGCCRMDCCYWPPLRGDTQTGRCCARCVCVCALLNLSIYNIYIYTNTTKHLCSARASPPQPHRQNTHVQHASTTTLHTTPSDYCYTTHASGPRRRATNTGCGALSSSSFTSHSSSTRVVVSCVSVVSVSVSVQLCQCQYSVCSIVSTSIYNNIYSIYNVYIFVYILHYLYLLFAHKYIQQIITLGTF